jgi:hypothetical protein
VLAHPVLDYFAAEAEHDKAKRSVRNEGATVGTVALFVWAIAFNRSPKSKGLAHGLGPFCLGTPHPTFQFHSLNSDFTHKVDYIIRFNLKEELKRQRHL